MDDFLKHEELEKAEEKCDELKHQQPDHLHDVTIFLQDLTDEKKIKKNAYGRKIKLTR